MNIFPYAMINQLKNREMVEAGKGHRGEPHYIKISSVQSDDAQRACMEEAVNKGFKQWGS